MLPVFSLLGAEVMKREKEELQSRRKPVVTAGQCVATPGQPLLPGRAGGVSPAAVPLWLPEGTGCSRDGDGAGGPARERAGREGRADGIGCATPASVPTERCDGP